MTPALPRGLCSAYRVAVSELGMCTAAGLFVDEVAAAGGAPLVDALRGALGAEWPVLDAVAFARLEGQARPDLGVPRVLAALEGVQHVVCVGLEAAWLDALASATDTAISIVRQSVFSPDWDRVQANYGRRVSVVGLEEFQRLAGPRSALLTFSYAADEHVAHVLPAWVRVSGDDVRTQFRELLAWEVLHQPFHRWPRWLVGVPVAGFSAVIR